MAKSAFLSKYFGRDALAILLVGGGGALAYVGLTTFTLGLKLGPPDWIVSGLCYGALVLPVYFAHRTFSFRSDAPHSRALPRYVGTQIMSVSLATILSYFAFEIFSFPALFGALAVAGLTALFSYLVLRLWTFAAPKN